jgi:hypothetical protein
MDRDGATSRESSPTRSRILANMRWLKRMTVVVELKRIEARLADGGIWLQIDWR